MSSGLFGSGRGDDANDPDHPKRRIGRRILGVLLRSSWLIAAVFGISVAAGSCNIGHATPKPVQNPQVRPKAFGPPGKCYYVAVPQECANQQAPGTPVPITPIWLATYWPYYTSPNYYSQVPVDDEDEYAQKIGQFASDDSQLIQDDSADGEWVDQDGNSWQGQSEDDPDSSDGSDDGGDDDGDDNSDGDSGDDGDGGGGDDGGDNGGDDD